MIENSETYRYSIQISFNLCIALNKLFKIFSAMLMMVEIRGEFHKSREYTK